MNLIFIVIVQLTLLQPVGQINGVVIDGFDLEYEYLIEVKEKT